MQIKSFLVTTILFFCVIPFTANTADWKPFPDTGQTLCYDVDGDEIDCPAEGKTLYGQDAQYTDVAQNFQDNGNDTISDLNTTLMWQNSDDGSRDWQDAMGYCAVLTLGGYHDWRLPEIIELQSIADYSGVIPTINPVFSCQSSSYWSATTYTYTPAPAWAINFYDGYVSTSDKVNTYNVRCVRGGRPSGSFDLSVILSGSGSGEVNFTPPDEKCTTSCSKNYTTGTVITLTAAADAGSSSFSGWSGGGCSGTGNCVVTMNQVREVTATFTLDPYTLTYTAGTNGSITGESPQTVHHGSDGSEVEAVPDPDYVFCLWDDGSQENPRTDYNVTADITVEAIFRYIEGECLLHTLTYTAGANGSINGPSPQTVIHGGDGLPVEAVPEDGYYFYEWSDDSKSNPRTDAIITADITVEACFNQIP